MYLNKATIYGNLTRDPEMKALPSGMNVTSFSLATNRRFKDRDGNYQDAVDYHNITVFGRQAETVNQYLKKGAGAFVEGRLQTRSWEKDGVKQYRTEIIADRVQFGPRSDGGGAGAPAGESANAPAGAPAAAATPAADGGATPAAPDYPEEDINPEDIPF
jgi:single-strand DNA-binding protein